jgi:hypothetical protein
MTDASNVPLIPREVLFGYAAAERFLAKHLGGRAEE